MEKIIGTIICGIGIIGILTILVIGAFQISCVLGLITIFVIMFLLGGMLAGFDDDSWYR